MYVSRRGCAGRLFQSDSLILQRPKKKDDIAPFLSLGTDREIMSRWNDARESCSHHHLMEIHAYADCGGQRSSLRKFKGFTPKLSDLTGTERSYFRLQTPHRASCTVNAVCEGK
jgi:hypothetical protein